MNWYLRYTLFSFGFIYVLISGFVAWILYEDDKTYYGLTSFQLLFKSILLGAFWPFILIFGL